MELLLNVVWMAISSAALLAWTLWRRSSSSRWAPSMLRGVIVLICVLTLLFPVISISDDLSQAVGLAEGSRLQDVLKSPEMRGIYYAATFVPVIAPTAPPVQAVVARAVALCPVTLRQVFWAPAIDRRPPPSLA